MTRDPILVLRDHDPMAGRAVPPPLRSATQIAFARRSPSLRVLRPMFALVAALAIIGGTLWVLDAREKSDPTGTTQITAAHPAVGGADAVYFFVADRLLDPPWEAALIPVARAIDSTEDPLVGLAEALLAGPLPDEQASDPPLVSHVPDGTRLLSLTFEEGIVVVDLSAEFAEAARPDRALAQVVFTLTRIDGVDGVVVLVEGTPARTLPIGWSLLDDPATRRTYEGYQPNVLIEYPARAATLLGGSSITGVGNVHEWRVGVEVWTSDRTLLDSVEVVATCLPGCRGEYDWASFEAPVTIDIASPTAGVVTAFGISSDGSRVDVRSQPVWLEPGPPAPPASSTTTTSAPSSAPAGVVAPGLGHLLGAVSGWPDDAVACSVHVVVWGPWPHRVASPACVPDAPAQFEFPFLPDGGWRVRVEVAWTSSDGTTGSRVNEFPREPDGWIDVPSGMVVQLAFDVVEPTGGLIGTMRDRATGRVLGGQYEPGAPIMMLVAHDAAGRFVTATGNRCDGRYDLWLPVGRYALSLVPSDLDPQPWDRVWFDGTPLEADPWAAIDPATVPDGAWVEFQDAVATTVDITVETAPHADAVPWAWYEEPTLDAPLPADDPWRDPAHWVGHGVGFDQTEWPPRLERDGVALPLHGFTAEAVRGGSDTIAVAAKVADGAVPSFRLLLAIDPTGIVTDALVVDTGLLDYASADGIAPHLPGVGLIVLARRDAPCELPDDPAIRAWRVMAGHLVEIDPAGAGVIPAG